MRPAFHRLLLPFPMCAVVAKIALKGRAAMLAAKILRGRCVGNLKRVVGKEVALQ